MPNSHKLNIFIVEDNDMYTMMLDHKLQQTMNYYLNTFKNGEECLNNLHLKPDVIILDYNLSGINGLETMKRIKLNNSDIPVIILSGQKDIQTAIDIMNEGAYDYIVKDKDAIHRLCKSIDKVISHKELKNENITLKLKINKDKVIMRFLFIFIFVILIIIIGTIFFK